MTQMLIPTPRAAPGAWSLLLVINREIAADRAQRAIAGSSVTRAARSSLSSSASKSWIG